MARRNVHGVDERQADEKRSAHTILLLKSMHATPYVQREREAERQAAMMFSCAVVSLRRRVNVPACTGKRDRMTSRPPVRFALSTATAFDYQQACSTRFIRHDLSFSRFVSPERASFIHARGQCAATRTSRSCPFSPCTCRSRSFLRSRSQDCSPQTA